MIKRMVKLTFLPDKVDDFLEVFESTKHNIRAFPGCQHLELWRDRNVPTVFFTYSYWTGEDALEAYRHSDLFKATWARIKVLFGGKPQAWSVDLVSEARLSD